VKSSKSKKSKNKQKTRFNSGATTASSTASELSNSGKKSKKAAKSPEKPATTSANKTKTNAKNKSTMEGLIMINDASSEITSETAGSEIDDCCGYDLSGTTSESSAVTTNSSEMNTGSTESTASIADVTDTAEVDIFETVFNYEDENPAAQNQFVSSTLIDRDSANLAQSYETFTETNVNGEFFV
jgi:hypothetical protein